jgi:hypothetical protein
VDVRIEHPSDAVEAPVLRLDASAARERLGWAPALGVAAAVDASVTWHEAVESGEDAREVTLRKIIERESRRRQH